MDKFITRLKEEVARELHETAKVAVGEYRPSFIGPPFEIMDLLYAELIREGGLKINTGKGSIPVPVFLVVEGECLPPGATGGRCNASMMVDIRNSFKYYLSLIPPRSSLNLSLSSSTTTFGVDTKVGSPVEWLREPFMQRLIRPVFEALDTLKGEVPDELFSDAVRVAGDLLDPTGEKVRPWEAIRAVVNIDVSSLTKDFLFLAACGVPSHSDEIPGNAERIEILKRISTALLEKGVYRFIADITEKACEVIAGEDRNRVLSAIEGFSGHLAGVITSAPEFCEGPQYYYSPFRLDCLLVSLPEWWLVLTCNVWDLLLEKPETTPPPENDPTRVEVENRLIPCDGDIQVVQGPVEFSVSPPPSTRGPYSVNCRKKSTITTMMAHAVPFVWADNTMAKHNSPQTYTFKAGLGGESTVKVISLDAYSMGAVLHVVGSGKVSTFKRKKTGNSENPEFECLMKGLSQGVRHELRIYHSSSLRYEGNSEFWNESGSEKEDLEVSSDVTSLSLEIDSLAAGTIVVEFLTSDGGTARYSIVLQEKEGEPKGVNSEFQRLIALNQSTSNVCVDLRPKLIHELQTWAIKSPSSYNPLILGYDAALCWHEPSWSNFPIISRNRSLVDIRPRHLDPPQKLLDYRSSIHAMLRDQKLLLVESARLGELVEEPGRKELVEKYLHEYVQWLEKSPLEATWYETILVVPPETDAVLAKDPDAVLLPPYHPLKLAWMANAQQLLWDAVRCGKSCPAAGVLNPSAVPDMLLLQAAGSTGAGGRITFVSVTSSNDYWSVLWNGNGSKLSELNTEKVKQLFNAEFGISVEGLSAGFSVSQVEKSLKDLSFLMSARAKLKVSICSESFGDSSCTAGILSWSQSNLGSEDPWIGAGKRELEVYDLRDESQHPSSEILANLTAEASGTVKWLKAKENGPGNTIDLGIINHLGGSNYDLAKHDISAGTSTGNLVRQRVRFELPSHGPSGFLAESRRALQISGGVSGGLGELVSTASSMLESMPDENSLTFAPNTFRLQQTLKKARFCSVSSTSVDPATFFDSSGEAYLWDYELPGFSARPGEDSGYFLLASPTDDIVETVRTGLVLVPGQEVPGDEAVKSILREVSGRGICTIKHLATGGATANGEIGLLVAGRLLIPLQGEGIIYPDEIRINLVMPIDPFVEQIDVLRKPLSSEKRRPDLLVASIFLHNASGCKIKLTPVEVKFRSHLMADKDMKDALQQASAFSPFLESVLLSPQNTLWEIAGLNLVVELLNYSFRVQGLSVPTAERENWARLQSRTISSVLSGNASFDIDKRGRAIIIDNAAESDIYDLDGDGFGETLRLSKDHAREVLFAPEPPFAPIARQKLMGWELLVDCGTPEVQTPEGAAFLTGTKASSEVRVASPTVTGPVQSSAGPWTEAECYLVILGYDFMSNNRDIVKTQLYKFLSTLIARTPKSIEYKLQNVSACDNRPRELKPINEMWKYQQLLKEVFDWFIFCHDKAGGIFRSVYGVNFGEAVTMPPKVNVNACLDEVQVLLRQELHATTLNPPQLVLPLEESAASKVNIPTINAEQLPAQYEDGVKFKVGESIGSFGGAEIHFHPSNTELNQLNIGIVGDLGTGKTQLIQALIYNLVKSKEQNRGHSPRFLIFDYKGDYSKEGFVSAVGAKVVDPFRVPLSLFDTSSSAVLTPWVSKANFFNDILDKIFPGMGYPQKEKVKQAIRKSYEDSEVSGAIPTIDQVFANYQTMVSTIDSPFAILSDICSRELFEPDPLKLVSFDKFFEGVTVVNLSKLGAENDPKNMLVIIFLNMFYDYMLKLDKKAFVGSSPQLRYIDSYLLVDEADNIMKYNFEVLKQVLLQGREFGVGVMLASQYLSHFKKPGGINYAEPLLTWFIHKVPNISTNELSALGIPDISDTVVAKIKSLKKHECLYKSLNVPGKFIRAVPFYELTKET